MSSNFNEITRNGFSSAFGRFCTVPGQVDRVQGASLRRMFLPKVTPEGKKQLRDSSQFVRGQLQHYGVGFDERSLTGNGTLMLKQALQAGKCDAVPAHILALQEDMHREWLNRQSLEYLATDPEWVMDKYFMRGVGGAREPDRERTKTVVGIPYPLSSENRAGNMREAAGKVAGLYYETARGAMTQTIYMGWDEDAVKGAVKGHAAKEKKEAERERKELLAQEKKREADRAKLHREYLQAQKKAGGRKGKVSPVGSYMVDCEEIKDDWPDQADELTLDIHETDEAAVFQACFDFGVLEGVMVIGTERKMLEGYCARVDDEGEDYSDEYDSDEDEEEDEEEDQRPKAGSKRKAPSPPRGRGRPKKAKAAKSRSLTYHMLLRCRETGEGQIFSDPDEGTIKFKDASLSSFVGEVDLPFVGSGVSFTARKVSDVPCSQQTEWAEFSEERSEYAGVNRWH
ncbi:hypothetical protein BJX61DRAFT_548286 [Aspergillus egyptiacus]|nr:hypothetical protein BJX61DRAFT_548286 [Aspergillus egyptiacus]